MMGGLTKKRIGDLEIEKAELERQLAERLTVRDHIAMAAMRAFVRKTNGPFDPKTLARGAYSLADAMMEARAQ